MEELKNHIVTMTDRESLSVTGVTDVDAFNEDEVEIITQIGNLSVRGTLLHVEELNLDTGDMKITGKITALVYTEHNTSTSKFKRLFGG